MQSSKSPPPIAESKSKRSIPVYMLRHGEREDEAPQLHINSRSIDSLDPYLTPLGHTQATAAWKQMLPELPPNKVLMATSPMRRTVGTAMMMAAAITQDESNPTTTTDILVVNGLSDCAMGVNVRGGSSKLLHRIPCAAKHGTAIQEELDYMKHHHIDDQDVLSHLENNNVRFCAWAADDRFVPMNSSDSLDGVKVEQDASFERALDRLARLALRSGAEALVVVTHREGIRDMINVCTRSSQRHSTPYCCIGTFQVAESSRNEDSLEWKYVRLDPYQSFQALP